MVYRPHPIRKIAKWLGISLGSAALLLLIMLGVGIGGLFWLAAHHSRTQPLDLLPYLPRIQVFLAERGLNLGLGTLQLYYDEGPVLRAEAVEIRSPDGELAVFAEAAAIKLAKGRLLAFQVSPKIIESRNVTLRLVRTPSGTVTIAGFEVASNNTDMNNTRGVVEWLEDLPSDSLWGRLKQLRVQGLTLLLRDEQQRSEWVLEDGQLSIDRFEDSGEHGTLLAQVRRLTGPKLNNPTGVNARPIPVLVGLSRDAGSDVVTVEAKFGQLNAAVIGDYMPAQLQDLVTGQGTLALGSVLTRGNMLGEPWLTLRLKKATLNLPEAAMFSAPLRFPQLEVTLSYQPAPIDSLTIRNLAITTPRGNLFVVSGSILQLGTSPTLNLTGFSPGGDVQAIFDFFPDKNPKLAKTYRWLRTNLKDAAYRNLTARAGLRLYAFPGCADACGPMQIDAEVAGGRVHFMDDMPYAVLTSSSQPATFHWRGQQLAVIAPAATVEGQKARSVWVNVDNIFSPSPTHVRVSGTLIGPIGEVVKQLNGIPEIGGRIPGSFGGTHSSILNVVVPLVRNITPTFASSTITLSSRLLSPSAVGLPVLGSTTLAAPEAALTLDAAKNLRITAARAELMGGRVGLIWQQNLQPKQPSAMQLSATGTLAGAWLQRLVGPATVSASGGILAAVKLHESSKDVWDFNLNGNLKGAALAVGPLNYRKAAGLPLSLMAQGRYTLDPAALQLTNLALDGHQAKVKGTLNVPLATPERGEANFSTLQLGQTDASVDLNKGTLRLRGNTLDLRGIDLNSKSQRKQSPLTVDARLNRIWFGKGALQDAVLQADSRTGSWNLQRVAGVVDGGGRLSIQRQGNRLVFNIPNLGRALEVFGLYDKLKDGTLFGTLTYRNATTASGELKLNDFALKNPPTMMKILGLLSLEQLVAGSDSTKFNSARLPLTLTDTEVALNNAQLRGPSMDLRLSGRYLRQAEQLDFNGSMAPALPFNRLVGKIPLLGTLLTGSQDGVVVADFRLSGPASDPEVTVRPLSILTPGLLKDLFRGGTNATQ